MKLGICYNVFDGHELLEKSVMSMRKNASFIVVVYQKISNFGDKSNPFLVDFLQDLHARNLIDELIQYEAREYSLSERRAMVSANSEDFEKGSVETIGSQFFNEISKREIGRKKLLEKKCTHYLLMDTDEFYLEEEMKNAMNVIMERLEFEKSRKKIFFKKKIGTMIALQ